MAKINYAVTQEKAFHRVNLESINISRKKKAEKAKKEVRLVTFLINSIKNALLSGNGHTIASYELKQYHITERMLEPLENIKIKEQVESLKSIFPPKLV